MTGRDKESQAIVGAAMRFVRTGDRSTLESYSLSALKKADYQLGNRDAGAGYRTAIKDLLAELEEKETPLNHVEQTKLRLASHPILAPMIIFGVIVISIGAFTDSLDKIWKFFETRLSVPSDAPTSLSPTSVVKPLQINIDPEGLKPYVKLSEELILQNINVTPSIPVVGDKVYFKIDLKNTSAHRVDNLTVLVHNNNEWGNRMQNVSIGPGDEMIVQISLYASPGSEQRIIAGNPHKFYLRISGPSIPTFRLDDAVVINFKSRNETKKP